MLADFPVNLAAVSWYNRQISDQWSVVSDQDRLSKNSWCVIPLCCVVYYEHIGLKRYVLREVW